MLRYERIQYEDAKAISRFARVEHAIGMIKQDIINFAYDRCIDPQDVEKQIRLHFPYFEMNFHYDKQDIWKSLKPVLDQVFSQSYLRARETHLVQSGAKLISKMPHHLVRHEKKVYIVPNDISYSSSIPSDNRLLAKALEAELGTVNKLDAQFIEEELHYLRTSRHEHVARTGLFIRGYKMPICYMGYCNIDREDKMKALELALGKHIDNREVVELVRVYGCGHLPKCSISLLDSFASRFILKDYHYILTAVNTALGFSGNSVRASGYVPYAVRPVYYSYDKNGHYYTKRGSSSACNGEIDRIKNAPPNILYVKELGVSDTSITDTRIIDIANGFNNLESELSRFVRKMRYDLELAWSDETRYSRTVVNVSDNPSKGQCGVSSLLLAKLLEKRGYYVLFCEGNALFPREEKGNDTSIFGHCWVRIRNYRGGTNDAIIDLTADQNGGAQKVIFKTTSELEKLNIQYIESQINQPKKPRDVAVSHLIDRLSLLEEKLRENGHIYG